MTNRCVAALGVVLVFGATAGSSAERHRDLRIVIETIDHSKQRYPTVGDWRIDKAGNLNMALLKKGFLHKNRTLCSRIAGKPSRTLRYLNSALHRFSSDCHSSSGAIAPPCPTENSTPPPRLSVARESDSCMGTSIPAREYG